MKLNDYKIGDLIYEVNCGGISIYQVCDNQGDMVTICLIAEYEDYANLFAYPSKDIYFDDIDNDKSFFSDPKLAAQEFMKQFIGRSYNGTTPNV